MKGIIFRELVIVFLLFICIAGTAEASSTWQFSENEYSSINFSYSGFDDPYLDYTTPVQLNVLYHNASKDPIDNSSGSCFLNFTSPAAQLIALNYSADGLYQTNLTGSVESLGNTFQIFCTDSVNSSFNHLFSDQGSAVSFRYDLYDPILVDVYDENAVGPNAGSDPLLLAGQETTIYLLLRNITGNETPVNLTEPNCTILLHGVDHAADPHGFGDYYTARFVMPDTGNLSLAGSCSVSSKIYYAPDSNLSVSPLLVPSGYDLGETDWYFQPILLAENGTDSYLISVPYEGGAAANIKIRQLGPTMNSLLTAAYEPLRGGFGFADLFTNGSLSMIYSGQSSTPNNLFSSSESGFSSELTLPTLGDLEYPTLLLADLFGTGLPSLLVAGYKSGIGPVTSFLTNNGNNLVEINTSLPDFRYGSACYGDFNVDTHYDLFISGENNSGLLTEVYLNNGSGFARHQTLPTQLYKSTCAIGHFLHENKTSLIHFGANDSASQGENADNWQYVVYNDTRNWSVSTSGLFSGFNGTINGDVVIADFSGDGLSDIFLCGGTSGNAVLSLYVNDLLESNAFIPVSPFEDDYALPECSLSAADYDFDGDLDLAYTGIGVSGEPIMLFNNSASENAINAKPSPPASINGSWDSDSGGLWINWSRGSDSETPGGMLSYNLEVESQGGNLLLSGQPVLTSKPFQGYLGNMQYRNNVTIYKHSPENVVVRVQSIDAGLQRSAWAESIIYWDDCTPQKTWEISEKSGCFIPESLQNNSIITISNGSALTASSNADLGFNTTIRVDNGTLDLSGARLNGINASIVIGEYGRLHADHTQLSGINLIFNTTISFSDSALDVVIGNATATLINTTWNRLNNSGLTDVRFYYEPRFLDQFDGTVSGVEIHVDDRSYGHSMRLNLSAYLINYSKVQSVSHAMQFSKSGYYNASAELTLSGNSAPAIILNKRPIPDSGEFLLTGLDTGLGDDFLTDISALSDAENITISNTGVGHIEFLEGVNLSYANFSESVTIMPNSISIDSQLAQGLNRSAKLHFEDLRYSVTPLVWHDGAICFSCKNSTYNGSAFETVVEGFSTYALTNNSELSIQTPSVLFNDSVTNFSIIYHGYGNTSDVIGGTECSISINSDLIALNEADGMHSTELHFKNTGTIDIQVNCSGNHSYEPLIKHTSLNVVKSGAYFIKEKEFTGSRYGSTVFGNFSGENRYWTTGHLTDKESNRHSFSYPSGFDLGKNHGSSHAALADLNNDGFTDLVIMGTTSSGTVFEWYDNLTDEQTHSIALSNGDFEVLDFDADGDLDLLACGEADAGNAQTVLLKNLLAENQYTDRAEFVTSPHTLPDVMECTLDVTTDDSGTWLFLAGTTGSEGNAVSLYRIHEAGFQLAKTLEPNQWQLPDISAMFNDFTEDGISDLIISGRKEGMPNTGFYEGTGDDFIARAEISEQLTNFSEFGTRLTSGYLSNETNQTLLISGISDAGLMVKSFGWNGSGFAEQDLALDVTPTYQGTLTLGDIDADTDLDLFLSGQSVSGPITHLYTNTLAEFSGTNQPPSPPSSVDSIYQNGRLFLNWSNGTDAETPDTLLKYALSIGTVNRSDRFLSGARMTTSNGRTTTNMGAARAVNISLPDACFAVQVRTMDAGEQLGVPTDQYLTNNHSEICNGYDNDCDGLVDEVFIYPGTSLFVYNGSLNGTAFTCSFYETYEPERLSCPDDPLKSPGKACQTDRYSGAVYIWNNQSKTCDCDHSSANLLNVQDNSGRRSQGGSIFTPGDQTGPDDSVDESENKPVDKAADTPQPSTSSDTKPHFTTSLDGFEVSTETEYKSGRTFIYHQIRNTERTEKEDIAVSVTFNPVFAEALIDLRSVNSFMLSDQFVLTAELNKLDYLEQALLLYSVPGKFLLSDIKNNPVTIRSRSAMSPEELAGAESKLQQKANTSIDAEVFESRIGNRTVIRVDLNLKENITGVHGVEIEQEIPKCLIEEITDSILESAIDPALLKHVEIKEADPLLVWRFDRLEDAVNLDLSLDVLRNADCEDEVTLKLLAKSFIFQNQPINKMAVAWVVLLSISLFALTLSPVVLSAKHRFHKHDNPHIVRLAKSILHRRHRGESDNQIIRHLTLNEELSGDIQEAFRHLNDHNPARNTIILYEHRVEIALFISVLLMSLLEVGGLLPGYLDWFKKVLSWSIMLVVIHHTNLSKLFFNIEAPRFSVALTTGFFLMHLVRLAEFALNGLSESVGFVFDWYVLIVRLDDSFHLSWILFSIGFLIVLLCSIYAARIIPIRKQSLCAVIFPSSRPQGIRASLLRAFGLLLLFNTFFFSVFNRMIEWLALAVDSALFVVTAIVLVALSLSMIAHHKGRHPHRPIERFGEVLADGYLVWLGVALLLFSFLRPFFAPNLAIFMLWGLGLVILFTLIFVTDRLRRLHELGELEKIPLVLDHLYEKFLRLFRYPRTLALALAGLPILQLVVESALYIIPNIIGTTSHLYTGHAEQTLLSFFSNTGLVTRQLFLMPLPEALAYAGFYLASLLGLVLILMLPVWVWAMAYRHRGHISGSVSNWLKERSHGLQRIGYVLIAATIPLGLFYLFHPALAIVPLYTQGSAGVQFVPQLIETPLADGIIALSLSLAGVLFIFLLFHFRALKTKVITAVTSLSFSMLIAIYFIPFVQSLWSETISLFSGAVPVLFVPTAWLLGSLQLIDILLVYLIGGSCAVYLVLPPTLKTEAIAILQRFSFFRRLQRESSPAHMLEYFDEAQMHSAGNLVHHLEHFIHRCMHEGITVHEQKSMMIERGYPKRMIATAYLLQHGVPHEKVESMLIEKGFKKPLAHVDNF